MSESILAAVHAAATPAPAPAHVEASVPLSDHTKAIDAARVEERAKGVKEGAEEERTRISGILDHPNAKGREVTARKLAFTTSMSVEEAAAFLSDLPTTEAKAGVPSIGARAQETIVGVGAVVETGAAKAEGNHGWDDIVAKMNKSARR